MNTGNIRITALAYFLVSVAYEKTNLASFVAVASVGFCFGFISPVVRVLTGQSPFGDDASANLILACRTWVLGCSLYPSSFFFSYPVLDALKRYRLSVLLLQMWGDAELSHEGTVGGTSVQSLHLPLQTSEDLHFFWLLVRLLGPNFNLGGSVRYGSAYVAVAAFFCAMGLGLLYVEVVVLRSPLDWGVAAELAIFCFSGAASIALTASICTVVNSHVRRTLGLLWRAALHSQCHDNPEGDPAFVGLAEAIT